MSKDAILEGMFAANSGAALLATIVLLSATFFTSFYSWRLIILTFFGKPRCCDKVFKSAAEDSYSINITLICLSVGSCFAGILFFGVFLGKGSELFFSESLFISPENIVKCVL